MLLNITAKPEFNVTQQEFHTKVDLRTKHAADAIKKESDIYRIQNYILYDRKYKNPMMRFRDNLLFTMGVNFGLRAGDLLRIQVGHVLTPEGAFRSKVVVTEGKTKKTREVFMNDSVKEALRLYLQNREIDLDDYLFKSYSNNNSKAYYNSISQKKRADGEEYKINGGVDTGMDVKSVERILKKIIMDELGLDVHASTHCLRKTFAYQVIMNAPDRSRAIEHLQMIFHHSSPIVTLRYAGITEDEIRDTYLGLNLGDTGCYKRNENIVFFDFFRSSGLDTPIDYVMNTG